MTVEFLSFQNLFCNKEGFSEEIMKENFPNFARRVSVKKTSESNKNNKSRKNNFTKKSKFSFVHLWIKIMQKIKRKC
jgi:hypothetical protein